MKINYILGELRERSDSILGVRHTAHQSKRKRGAARGDL